jgi:hypothetical protein
LNTQESVENEHDSGYDSPYPDILKVPIDEDSRVGKTYQARIPPFSVDLKGKSPIRL